MAVIDSGWRPYSNSGRWLWTDCGWYWQSDYSWGWAPFHYGRWYRSPRHGWVWAPDTTWGPAWVTWRYSDTYCGWAPLPPGAYFDVGVGFRFGGGRVGVGFDFGLVPDCFTFIPTTFFCDYRPWRHCIPRTQVVNIFHRTTIVNNYATGPNGNVIVNVGPGRNAIAAVTRTEIRKLALRDSSPAGGTVIKADRLDRDGKTLAVFRPKLPQQAATPPPQVLRHQQDLRNSGELLARSGGITRQSPNATRGTLVVPSAGRGTPVTASKPVAGAVDDPAARTESPRGTIASPPQQIARPSLNRPPVSTNPRSERRSSQTAQSAPAIVRRYQNEPAARSLAEASPNPIESSARNRGERSPVYQPPQAQPELRSPPIRREPISTVQPGYQPQSGSQVITPPVYRQEGRKFEPPTYTPSTPAHPAVAPPVSVAPRATEPRFSSPGYQPPQSFSPPAAAPRVIEAPVVARPSSPPPSYSPPPAPSHPQPAPSSSTAHSRSDGGRKP
ncbi:MAG: hypothetical protein DME19_08530 [Verrucomicrobia bacterium]|nr:MAG: hypothetical protein DME19_08530 [Verrucomicrobiota bacterium]